MAGVGFRSHRHHLIAAQWFERQTEGSCAFCRVTQSALLRHLTNAVVMNTNVRTMREAWEDYDRLHADRRVIFLDEPLGSEVEWRRLTQEPLSSHRVWTDAYLAAFAIAGGLRLSSFDCGFARFAGLDFELLGG